MPPDPVLALLALLCLAAYAVIGGTVGALTVKLLDKPNQKYIRDLASKSAQTGAAPGAFFAALLWPAWLAFVVAAGTVVAVAAGPIWIGLRVTKYTANAALKEG